MELALSGALECLAGAPRGACGRRVRSPFPRPDRRGVLLPGTEVAPTRFALTLSDRADAGHARDDHAR